MTGDIDTTLPICTTHLLDRDSSIIHAHGGIATEVTFDRLEEMTRQKETATWYKDLKIVL